MKINHYIFIAVIVIIFLFLFLNNKNNSDISKAVTQSPQPSKVLSASDNIDNRQDYDAQTKTFGAVEVEVKPLQITPGKEIVLQLSLNTHSVNLDYDYTKIATLVDDLDDTYGVISWSGGIEGHHLQGELKFKPLGKNVKKVTLNLSDIDGETHSFSWDL